MLWLNLTFTYLCLLFSIISTPTDAPLTKTGTINLNINTTIHSQPVDKNLYGITVSNLFRVLDVTKPDFIKFDTALSPVVLRWPGGAEAMYVHWDEKGYGFVPSEVSSAIKEIGDKYESQGRYEDQNNAKVRYIDQFVTVAKRTNSSVLLQANILTGTPHEMNEQIRFFKSHQIKIAGVELGNELYTSKLRNAVPNVNDYINICKPFADSLRKYFPELPIAVCVAPNKNFKNPSRKAYFDEWNQTLAKESWYDSYIVHSYNTISCQNKISGIDNIYNCANNSIHSLIDGYMTTSISNYANLFGAERKIWITEWNIGVSGNNGLYGNTLLQAMYIVNFHLWMNEYNQSHNHLISIATYHTLAGVNFFSCALMPPKEKETYRDKESNDITRRSGYFANWLMKDVYLQQTRPVNIELTDGNTITTNKNLINRCFYDDKQNEIYIYLINKSGQPFVINSIAINNSKLNTSKTCEMNFISGDKLYSSFGMTNFTNETKTYSEAKLVSKSHAATDIPIDGYCVGFIKIKVENNK